VSIARKLSAIRSLYRYLLREGMVSANLVKAASSPKLERRLPAFLTVAEARHLVEAPDPSTPAGQRDRAILELLYASGLRVSELAGLDLDQIDFDTNEIRVLGKGDKKRVVLMGQPAAQALRRYRDEGRAQLRGNRKNSAFFLNHFGQRLTQRGVQARLAYHARASGIEKRVHPHTLRHTFATHLLDGGADLRVVQELLGHASLSSTQIYTHVTKSQARKIYLRAHPMAQGKKDEPLE
ncbi:MAG: tyrosine-type recombinase/integrase, partial [Chloroflexota bacterium]